MVDLPAVCEGASGVRTLLGAHQSRHTAGFFSKLMMTRRERRALQRQARKAPNKFKRSMREIRIEFFSHYGVDFASLLRETADARRRHNLCECDDDVRIYASKEEAEMSESEPDTICECGKARLRIPIVAPPWLAEFGADEREIFMTGLFK